MFSREDVSMRHKVLAFDTTYSHMCIVCFVWDCVGDMFFPRPYPFSPRNKANSKHYVACFRFKTG